MNRHGRTATINMYFGSTVLNGKIGNMPGEYYMRGPGGILDSDKIIHKNCFNC